MGKRKLTSSILQEIEDLAFNGFSLDDIQEEADITHPLMEDAQVKDVIAEGRRKAIIEQAVEDDGNTARDFVETSGMTIAEHKQIHDENLDVIKAKKDKRRERQKENSKDTLDAAARSGHNVYLQHDPRNQKGLNSHDISDAIKKTAQDLKNGDTSCLLELLVGNITQLNLFNGVLAMNLSSDGNMTLDKMNKLSNMQLKTMQEMRKSIMAINEITNPKRTTFIKEANQHNYLPQNSEKKDENENELQKLEEPAKCDTISDIEILSLEEAQNEKKLR